MERHCLLPTTPVGDLADLFVWHPSKKNKNINHVLPFLRCRLLHQKCSIFLTETHLLGIGRLGTWLIPLTWRFQRSLLSVIIPNSGLGNIRLFIVTSILTIISMHTCTLNLFWQFKWFHSYYSIMSCYWKLEQGKAYHLWKQKYICPYIYYTDYISIIDWN